MTGHFSPTEGLHGHRIGLVETIEDGLTKCRIVPCLTLLYVGMDVG